MMTMAALAADMSLGARAHRVAAVSAEYADRVDQEGRFPREAVDAMKAGGWQVQAPFNRNASGASLFWGKPTMSQKIGSMAMGFSETDALVDFSKIWTDGQTLTNQPSCSRNKQP